MYSLQGFPDEGSDNMKIEKVNENQIRCTLTREDLAERQIKLSELAYGTEKAKMLFRDMMQQAAYEFGFEADDIPLMIEAIPLSADTIILVITKVEYPEELDTRFSKFTPAGDSDTLNSNVLEKLQGADEFFDLLNKVKEVASEAKDPEPKETVPTFPVRLFSFDTLDSVIEASRLLAPFYTGANTLYKDEENNNTFILALAPADGADQEFNKVCNMLSEYSSPEKGDSSVLAFLEEHCEVVISSDAIQKLSQV